MKKRLVLAALLPCATLSAPAQVADWTLNAAPSRLEFAATFETLPAPGRFKDFDVRLRFDPGRPEGGRLDVAIQMASADMSSADINQAIAGAEWFDFARHPRAEFHATDLRRAPAGAPAGSYVARGSLTLKGVQQPVEVPFTWNALGDSATMEGSFTVQRAAFRIGTGEWAATDVIGPTVTVKFQARLRKTG